MLCFNDLHVSMISLRLFIFRVDLSEDRVFFIPEISISRTVLAKRIVPCNFAAQSEPAISVQRKFFLTVGFCTSALFLMVSDLMKKDDSSLPEYALVMHSSKDLPLYSCDADGVWPMF